MDGYIIEESLTNFGAKIKDYELIGIPHAVVIGKKLQEGVVEFVTRKGLVKEEVPADTILAILEERL